MQQAGQSMLCLEAGLDGPVLCPASCSSLKSRVFLVGVEECRRLKEGGRNGERSKG